VAYATEGAPGVNPSRTAAMFPAMIFPETFGTRGKRVGKMPSELLFTNCGKLVVFVVVEITKLGDGNGLNGIAIILEENATSARME
jgi:hypothetical protein